MSANEIKAEFGTVVGQLVEYPYTAIQEEQRTKGQKAALVSSRGWVESVLTREFQPKGSVIAQFHNHDETTCDAVQIRYSAGSPSGEFELRVSQTIFVITVTVSSRVPPANWKSLDQEAATQFARGLFQQAERINLRLEKDRHGVLLGRQASTAAAHGELDWLDTLKWWSDGASLGFSAVKRVGRDQSGKTSTDLQPNQFWFRMFEQSRVR